MNDPHARPSDEERKQLSERITRAATASRIGAADRDIRLANVRSAQSRTELDLITRELDQLDQSLPVATEASTPAAPYSKFNPRAVKASVFAGRQITLRGSIPVILVVVFLAVMVAGSVGFFSFMGSGGSSAPRSVQPASSAAPVEEPDPSAGPEVPGGYSLTAAGVTRFVSTYRTKFGTTKIVDTVLYDDYVVVHVPVKGARGRQDGWVYREGSGWTSFGGVSAVFPGAVPVQLKRLDVAALMRNLGRARRTLRVEDPVQSYVVIRWTPRTSATPDVNIYVANRLRESGYLATRLDGTVERAYPSAS